MHKNAFTLIELLIVISIIGFIGIASITGFSRMAEVQDAETTTNNITNSLASYDRAVSRHEITSYDAVFASGSRGFLSNLDWYKKSAPLKYSFDFVTGTGMVQSSGIGPGDIELRFVSHDVKGEISSIALSGGIQAFSFPKNIQKRWYEVLSALSGTNLNSFVMQYYNLTNVQSTTERETYVIKIVGGNDTQYDSLTVRNILGKKTLLGSGTTLDELESATLTLEKSGREIPMVISSEK